VKQNTHISRVTYKKVQTRALNRKKSMTVL